MKILGIETATIVCGAAVVIDGVVVSNRHISRKNAHAESIMQLIDTVVHDGKVQLSEIDAVAVSIGPGSFTGLRIGLSVAKGLCFSMDKPLVAVPTLTALAHQACASDLVRTSFIVSTIDARRDEVYCHIFRATDDGIVPDSDAIDLTIAGLIEALDQRDVTITGDAIVKLKADGRLTSVQYLPEAQAHCDASAIALLGEQAALRGDFADARTCEPVYIKEFFMNVPK